MCFFIYYYTETRKVYLLGPYEWTVLNVYFVIRNFYKRIIENKPWNGHFPIIPLSNSIVKISLNKEPQHDRIESKSVLYRTLVKSVYRKFNFLISQPKHML